MSGPRANVEIPGTFTATWDEETGTIVRMEFVPKVADPGYSGPIAELVGWSEPQGPIDLPDGLDLDVDQTGGPFWEAMRDALTPVPSLASLPQPSSRQTVPIEWTE